MRHSAPMSSPSCRPRRWNSRSEGWEPVLNKHLKRASTREGGAHNKRDNLSQCLHANRKSGRRCTTTVILAFRVQGHCTRMSENAQLRVLFR